MVCKLYLNKTFLKTEMCFQLSLFVELLFLEGLPRLGQSRMTIPVAIGDLKVSVSMPSCSPPLLPPSHSTDEKSEALRC